MSIPPYREDGWLPEGHFAATWEEVAERFGGVAGSRRARLTARSLQLRDDLRRQDVSGTMVVDGS